MSATTNEANFGQANEAFENIPEDEVNKARPKTQVVEAFTADEESTGNSSCRLFGFIALPDIFQRWFLCAPWVLVFLCWASTMQGMVINGFVNVGLSTLERRFGLQSTDTGVIAGSYDIGSMLSIIPIAYFGGRVGTSKPKYI